MEIAIFAFSVVAADRFIQNAIFSSTELSLTGKTRFTKTKLDLPPCSSKPYVCRTASIFTEQQESPGIQRKGLRTKCLFLHARKTAAQSPYSASCLPSLLQGFTNTHFPPDRRILMKSRRIRDKSPIIRGMLSLTLHRSPTIQTVCGLAPRSPRTHHTESQIIRDILGPA